MSKPLIFYRFALAKDVLTEMEENPKEFLYGADQLIKEGKVDALFVSKGKRNSLLRKILYFIEKPVAMTLYLGMPLEIVLENWNKVKSASVIFCINDAISFAVLFFKWTGLIKTPAVTLLQSTSERNRKYFKDNKIAKWFVRSLLLKSELILTLSKSAKNELIKEFGVKEEKVEVFHFGVDSSFWTPSAEERGEYILSVGNDHNRDFKTLIEGLSDRFKIKLVTRLPVSGHKNVDKLNGLTNEELLSLYQNAFLVVTPSKELKTESSGLSSSLQAMSCGIPVVVSESEPMRESFLEGKEISFFRAEDVESLKKTVFKIADDIKFLDECRDFSRKKIVEKFNTINMGNQLKKILSRF